MPAGPCSTWDAGHRGTASRLVHAGSPPLTATDVHSCWTDRVRRPPRCTSQRTGCCGHARLRAAGDPRSRAVLVRRLWILRCRAANQRVFAVIAAGLRPDRRRVPDLAGQEVRALILPPASDRDVSGGMVVHRRTVEDRLAEREPTTRCYRKQSDAHRSLRVLALRGA